MSQHTPSGAPRAISPHHDGAESRSVEPDDLTLVTQAKAGDHAAFGLLAQRYGKAVLNVIDKMIRDRSIVEDLWQETFVRALENLSTYEPRSSGSEPGPSFASWLYRIAANLTLDELRRRNRWRMFSWDSFKLRRTNEPEDEESYDSSANAQTPFGRTCGQREKKHLPRTYRKSRKCDA